MGSLLLGLGSALWLGILTSISPCPMATNIAAISFIAKRLGHTRSVLLSGLLYTAGRSCAYILVAALIIAGALSIPQVSNFLQTYMNKLLGPILILVGMYLLELIKVNLPGLNLAQKMQERTEKGGVWTAGVLGAVFAMSFCPVSAALFFGGLIPLSIEHGSRLLLPALFGVGTGLPVVLFAVLIAFSAQSLGQAFKRLTQFELWARRITGTIFICIGIYYSLTHIFGII